MTRTLGRRRRATRPSDAAVGLKPPQPDLADRQETTGQLDPRAGETTCGTAMGSAQAERPYRRGRRRPGAPGVRVCEHRPAVDVACGIEPAGTGPALVLGEEALVLETGLAAGIVAQHEHDERNHRTTSRIERRFRQGRTPLDPVQRCTAGAGRRCQHRAPATRGHSGSSSEGSRSGALHVHVKGRRRLAFCDTAGGEGQLPPTGTATTRAHTDTGSRAHAGHGPGGAARRARGRRLRLFATARRP